MTFLTPFWTSFWHRFGPHFWHRFGPGFGPNSGSITNVFDVETRSVSTSKTVIFDVENDSFPTFLAKLPETLGKPAVEMPIWQKTVENSKKQCFLLFSVYL